MAVQAENGDGARSFVELGHRHKMTNATGVGELLGPMGLTALHDTDCTILVVDRQRLL